METFVFCFVVLILFRLVTFLIEILFITEIINIEIIIKKAAKGNKSLGTINPECIENPMIIFAKAEAAPIGPNNRFACRVVNL